MEFIHILVLSVIQGLTEFLPISSSAHLIIAPRVLGWVDQGVWFDLSVHLGSLCAVIIYFRKRIISLVSGWLVSITQGGRTQAGSDARLAWMFVGSDYSSWYGRAIVRTIISEL